MATSFRFLVIGEGGVGKSTLIERYRGSSFIKEYIPSTIESLSANTFYWQYRTPKCEYFYLELIDTAGQEEIPTEFCQNLDGIIAIYDITNSSTLIQVRRKIDRVLYLADAEIPVVYLANKCDLFRPGMATLPTHFPISARNTFGLFRPLERLIAIKRGTAKDEKIFY